jgi:hypothetical protein
MREITEDEAIRLAGDAECPVLRKEESDPMEAAVCLKRFPTGYVLGPATTCWICASGLRPIWPKPSESATNWLGA